MVHKDICYYCYYHHHHCHYHHRHWQRPYHHLTTISPARSTPSATVFDSADKLQLLLLIFCLQNLIVALTTEIFYHYLIDPLTI